MTFSLLFQMGKHRTFLLFAVRELCEAQMVMKFIFIQSKPSSLSSKGGAIKSVDPVWDLNGGTELPALREQLHITAGL